MADNTNTSAMQTKQKVMIAVTVIIFIIIGWQLKGMLFGSQAPVAASPIKTAATTTAQPVSPAASAPPPGGMKEAPLPARSATMTEGEKSLLALQMQTEAKYIAAMNELQLLRVQSEIAKSSKDIAQNRLDAVTAQKQTLQLLSAPQATAATYAQGLSGELPISQGGLSTNAPPPVVSQHPQAAYVVVSVSQLQHRWTAVLGYQGQLYNVRIGDILTPDAAKVIEIDRHGVTLERGGHRQRISLVSLI